MIKTKCPVCHSEKTKVALELSTSNFDCSPLYSRIVVVYCLNCNHIFNKLADGEIKNLLNHYEFEYTPVGIYSLQSSGYTPGGENSYTISLYEEIFNLVPANINKDVYILDIGCAAGGFLKFLQKKGFSNLYGIDFDKQYAESFQLSSLIEFKSSSIEAIPYPDEFFDLVFLDQVLEHISDLRIALSEIFRVVKHDGYVCLGIPDSLNYEKEVFFEYYWFLLREHIQHFNIKTLTNLFNNYNFALIGYTQKNSPMVGAECLPNLNAIYQKKKISNYNTLSTNIQVLESLKRYLSESSKLFNQKINIINNLTKQNKTIYIWGIGREFLFLYNNTSLNNYKKLFLVDVNQYKQNNFRVNGLLINSPELLYDTDENSILLITAMAHKNKIMKNLEFFNFKGTVVTI